MAGELDAAVAVGRKKVHVGRRKPDESGRDPFVVEHLPPNRGPVKDYLSACVAPGLGHRKISEFNRSLARWFAAALIPWVRGRLQCIASSTLESAKQPQPWLLPDSVARAENPHKIDYGPRDSNKGRQVTGKRLRGAQE